ncbi:MAG: phosphatidylinositol-specific phospholipase C1-like protein [Balneolaceae bacterium]|nr:phosphatidylinositol-specific phospholipase C1-like protein [Balneolaceae bacterium]
MSLRFSILLLISIMGYGCSGNQDDISGSNINCDIITADNADQCIRLNHVQVLGTHNSYKRLPHPDLITALNNHLDGWAKDIEYEHKPLAIQLENLGIRQFELDLYADPNGGRYAKPSGAVLIDDEEFLESEEMMQPGFKIIHIPDVDYRSTCLTFKSCLTDIGDWSDKNPNHLPIMIMVEAKDGERRDWEAMKFVKPIAFNTSLMHEIDNEILEVFEPNHIITPDDVRNNYDTLTEAVQDEGWPTLAESRGKVLFALDNTDEHKSMYLKGNPNLEGRVMFVSSVPEEPTGGFIKMNDALRQANLIKERISQGYLIRTRTDSPTNEARSGSTKRMEIAFESGAQYLSTDYPEVSPFGSGYIVRFPNTDGIARCNPISAPIGCQNLFLEE